MELIVEAKLKHLSLYVTHVLLRVVQYSVPE